MLGWVLGWTLGCVRVPAALPVEADPALTPSPPPVWTEVEEMPTGEADTQPEFRDASWIDPTYYQDKIIGIAHGPSRADEAERVADAIRDLNLPLDDMWSVDARTWYDEGITYCRDQVVYYNADAAGLASALRASLPMTLALTEDTGSRYDVIVQLCPRTP